MSFAPIAIVGRSCLLPGVRTPGALFRAVCDNEVLLRDVPKGQWRVPTEHVLAPEPAPDHTWTTRGGYVDPIDPKALPGDIAHLDPLVHWVVHTAQEALRDAGAEGNARTGLILGNLSLPSAGLSRFAEQVWLGELAAELGVQGEPLDRFMSGMPAQLAAKILGLRKGYALDAACASSLYALELACRALQDGRADRMLAGAVNRADDLFLHVGFSALGALSRSGQSRPFHAEADGLIAAEGAGFVVLERLEDAKRRGQPILGVIRGVGLANDGRGRGILAPSASGQERAMRAAFQQSGLSPADVAYVECHATGTTVGDATELRSMEAVYGGSKAGALPIGSLKGNVGHPVTAAGVAGLIKLIEALREETLPPTASLDRPSEALQNSPFEVLEKPAPWKGPRRAALSAFGFGGNDAHVLVEAPSDAIQSQVPAQGERTVVVVSVGARVGDGQSLADFEAALFENQPVGPAREVHIPRSELRFPPRDLAMASGQQTMLLSAGLEATRGLDLDAERTGVFVGYQCDPEIARWGARWRTRDWASKLGADEAWIQATQDAFVPPLEASHVVGTLPNMPANRLSSQLDLKGPSFTVAAETQSGTEALSIAMRALRAGELEFALVGAVDLSHEVVHRAATSGANAADAAVVLTLCTEEVARERGLPVLATLEPTSFTPSATVRDRIGSAHAAETLLEVTAGILSCARGQRIGGAPWTDTTRHQNVAGVSIEATAISPRATAPEVGATLTFPARRPAVSVPPVSIPPLSRATQGTASMQTMPPAPWLPPVGEAAPTSAPSARTSAQPQPIAGAVSATAMAHAAPPSTTTTTVTSAATPPATIAATARSTPALPPSAPPDALPPSTAPGALPPSTAPGALPPSTAPIAEPQPGVPSFLAHFTAHQRRLGEIHRAFLEQQSALHQQFLQTTLFVPTANVPAGTQPATALPSAAQASVPMPLPMPVPKSAALPTAVPAASPTVPLPRSAPPTAPASQGIAPPTASKAAPPVPVSVPEDANAHAHPPRATPTPQPNGAATELPLAFKPRGPSFDRDALKVHASGKISTIFGPLFEQQDGYAVQVRMPEPPLLLADRCTGMDAEPGSMGKGTCWTETDVRADSWYLQHDGHMPAGIMIESGQADLMLISYLGADFANKGERSYRLLGCEMTWLGDLPKVGETLAYDIHIDGHAQQGDVRLFFFHYDCWVRRADGTYRPALRVRHGQAGFFTDEELADSAGILWKPEEQEIRELPRSAQSVIGGGPQGSLGGRSRNRPPETKYARVDPPAVDHGKRSFTGEELRAFADGEPWRCFGEGVMRTKTHTRTPQIQSGRMLFLDEVTEFDPRGGPWGRGYLKGVAEITPDKWFFDGHFKNDPCMPGTLMLEGCVQTMAFYLSALGYTVDKDGWRFQPIIDETYKLICRGQVTPTSKHLTYEVFVEEVHDGPEPMLYADLLCTVDGLGAFHARRFGLKLVPGWPLSSVLPRRSIPRPPPTGSESPRVPPPMTLRDSLRSDVEADPRAALGIYEGTSHRFDYASLLACAWGQPSTAFGPMYARFDGTRRTPRLPGPPYHFLTRVTQVGGAMGELETGCDFEFEYEVPEDVWYFGENGAKVMPFAVLLEAALQPCGWIASYVGSTLTSEDDFLFRNLDGTGTIHAEVVPSSGTLRTEVRNKNLSRSAGMIIVSFDVRCFVGDTLVYELDTVFGFFPPSAFDNQQGLPATDEQRALLAIDSDYSVDLRARPAKYCSGSARLAEPFLLMLDRITHWDATGGRDGLGCLRGEKDVDPGEWFFKAHFYQDPVQPGSLGIEAMLQALQFHMLEAGMDEGMEAPRFEAIATGMEHVWKYRGQVVPENKLISTTLEIVEVGEDARGRFVRGDCSLWVDGKRIYEAPGLGMRLVDGAPEGTSPGASDSTATSNGAAKGASNGMSAATATKASASSSTATVAATTGAATSSAATSGAITAGADGTLTLTPAAQPWLLDHCPTHTLPALPMMSIVDLMLGAARAELGEIHALSNVRMERWVVIDQSARLRTEVEGREVRVLVWRDAANPKLSRFEVAARARIETPSFEPLRDAVTSPVADPYATDALFHGPAFHYLVSLERGTDASRGVLDAAKGTVPYGAAHQGLLDAVTHILPHDQLSLWSDQVGDDVVAYPHHLDLQLYEALPTEGQVECEARFEGFEDAEKRFPIFRMQLRKEGRALADFRLVEVLMPKGRLGVLPPSDRRRFLRDALPIPGATLSAVHDAGATLDASDVRLCDWLPGTVRQAYGLTTRELSEIAIKDHLSQRVGLHPQQIEVTGDRAIAASLPLTSFQYETAGNREAVAVRLTGEALTIDRVRAFWREFFGLGSWPVEDLYYALLRQFVGRFHVDPGLQALQGRGVLYLGNHQVGIESLLFSIVTGALQRVPTLTLAKDEHRQSWLGQLIALCFRYPGAKDPGVITHFDRSDPASLPRIAKNLAGEAGAKSLMVHVEGTRAHSAGHRVSTMSGIFCDLAIQANVPIVPVRFTRGLPSEPAADKLEYPVGMGRQDYHLGAPIFPEALKGLPYKERTESVVAAINALGPAEDTPSAPNGELATRVATWMEQSGVSVGLATILEVLRDAPDASESVRRLARGASSRELAVGPSPEEQWLGELATLLYGR